MKTCSKCGLEKELSEFYKNKNTKDGYRWQCKTCDKEYRLENLDKIKEYIRIYQRNHKQRPRSEYMATYHRLKRKNDPNYKITSNLRKRIGMALDNNSKKRHTLELLGCDIEFLKIYLQYTAYSNDLFEFDINNYEGKDYHIDHIIPCAAFNMSCGYHQKLCFHYSNLQILTAEENLSKGDRQNECKN